MPETGSCPMPGTGLGALGPGWCMAGAGGISLQHIHFRNVKNLNAALQYFFSI
jgi:hypothetical protein